MKAVDDDQEPSGQITYSINDIEPSDVTKLMSVNKYTGVLVLQKSVETLSEIPDELTFLSIHTYSRLFNLYRYFIDLFRK